MKTKQSFSPAVLLAGFTLISGLAFAADPDYPSNTEKSFATQAPPAEKTAAEIRAELDELRHTPVSPDGWVDVGGEHGDKFAGNIMGGDNLESPGTVLTAYEQMIASVNYRVSQ